MLLSSQNKWFRADPNYIKEMEIKLENFAIVRDKKFPVEIRIFPGVVHMEMSWPG